MIYVEPIPNRRVSLLVTVGTPNFTPGGQQIAFPVRAAKRRHAYNDSVTRLTTGGTLEELEGDMTLYRGKPLPVDEGQWENTITYVPKTPPHFDIGATDAGFSVTLQIDERLFDQLVPLCRMSQMPTIKLDFKQHSEEIGFGDAPDGSEVVWDTKNHETLNIVGATLFLPLADHIENDEVETPSPPLDPEIAPATIAQIDHRFAELFQILAQLRTRMGLLAWGAFTIALILLIKQFV